MNNLESYYNDLKSNKKPNFKLDLHEDSFLITYKCENMTLSEQVNVKFEGVKYNEFQGLSNVNIKPFLSITAKEYIEYLLTTTDFSKAAPQKAEQEEIKVGVNIADFIDFANAKNIVDITSIDYIEFSRSSTTCLDSTQDDIEM